MVLNQCGAEVVTLEDSMEGSSSISVNSYLIKRKAEFISEEDEESDGEIEEGSDPKAIIDEREADKAFSEWDEESDGEIEEGSDPKVKVEEREAEFDMLMAPEWDVDSFDGLEYYSSPELQLSSSDEPLSDDEEAIEHYRIYKRQIIESKGFYADPELRPSHHYKRIRPMSLEWASGGGITFQEYWEEMVGICLQKLNQDKGLNVELVEVVRGYYRGAPRSKSYITFMAKEKPDGPLVEYQAKCMLTFDSKLHPILCRPAPTPKP